MRVRTIYASFVQRLFLEHALRLGMLVVALYCSAVLGRCASHLHYVAHPYCPRAAYRSFLGYSQ